MIILGAGIFDGFLEYQSNSLLNALQASFMKEHSGKPSIKGTELPPDFLTAAHTCTIIIVIQEGSC